MKKHLHNSLRALFLSLAVLLSLPMLAEQVEIDGINYDLNAKAEQATVLAKGSGKYSGEVVIPESVEYEGTAYSVTSIGKYAFYDCSGLTSVTIGSGVTSIGYYAFYLSTELQNVYCYAENVPSTASNAFDESNYSNATLHVPAGSIDSYNETVPWSAFETIVAITTEVDGINYDFNADTKEAIVIAKSSGEYSGEVVIPESVEYGGTAYSVTSIGDDAFSCCDGLTSVTIGNSVTSIGENAFFGCNGLTSVHISDIAAWCNIDFENYLSNPLYNAHHLYLNEEEVKDLVIPNSVESIGKFAFYGCSGLTSVTIPNSVTSIGENAFSDCSGLTSVTIGNSVTSIGKYAFYGCSGLTSVTIPNSVESIGKYAFERCSGLTSVTIGNSVKSIEEGAFNNCSGLTSVTIPNSVTSIGYAAFSDCSGLTSVTIPNSVTSIEWEVFSDCFELIDVYCYAENVPSTESNAFMDSPIKNATLHVPAASIDSYKAKAPWSGFGSIVAITTEVEGINYDFDAETKQATVIKKSNGEYSGKVVIPESVEHAGTAYSVTSIGDDAFRSCSSLTSVTIPNSVTSIGKNTFSWCSGLTSVTIGNSVKSIGDYAFYYCSGLTSVTIPNSVTSTGDDAFANCSGLTSVTIGNSVKSIENGVFWRCSGLTSVTIPNSVTSIGGSAFGYCSGLTSVTIPNSVKSIGESAFAGCSDLTSVTIPNSVTSMGNGVFTYCKALTSVTIGNSVKSIGEEAFRECSGLTSVTIGNSVTSIGGYAFYGCKGLTSVTIPNSVTSIGDYAFYGCSGLTSVTIPNSVTSIADYAFASCFGLTSVTIPNSVTSIGNYAFIGCSDLTSVTIPNSVTSIGDYAFYACSCLTSVTIPNSVTSIGQTAFYGCSGLTSVTIGNSVESIGWMTFGNCSKLSDVYCYAENVPSTESNAFESSPIGNATLHVPNASVDSYNATAPWSSFGTITPLVEDLTLTDDEEFENNTEQTFSTLTYTRTLPNMLWNPLYVPFKIPYEVLEENYEVAYINAMHSYDNDDNGEIDEMVMEIVKIKAGTLKPNHPYLIKAKNDEAMEMSIVQENATLYPAEITTLVCSSVYTKFEITGTYQEMTSEDLNGSLVISADGAWKLLSSTSTLKPFRFYLTISNLEGSPVEIAEEAMSSVRIRVMGESDNATGIDETEITENSVVFDLSGRRVSTPAKGGVYIINGKKVIY